MKRIPPAWSFVAATTACVLLSGCASIAGVGGTSGYGCKAPEGVKCDSVSGTYFNAVENNLPSQRQGHGAPPTEQVAPTRIEAQGGKPSVTSASDGMPVVASLTRSSGAALPPAAYTSMPLRSPARVLRLWVKPWEDADGDLMDQLYVYVPVDNGRWLVDHAQRQIRDAYAPIKAPRTVRAPNNSLGRESANGEPREPVTAGLKERLQAARGLMPLEANASGASDVK